jgi:hypothetical protein
VSGPADVQRAVQELFRVLGEPPIINGELTLYMGHGDAKTYSVFHKKSLDPTKLFGAQPKPLAQAGGVPGR